MKNIFCTLLILLLVFNFSYSKTFYTEGNSQKKRVALTFDDGPGKATGEILEILRKKKVKATFFMLGSRIEKESSLAMKVFDEGHEIGNHTNKHINFYSYSESGKKEKIEREILKSQKSIENVLGFKPFLLRYPYGYSGTDALETARKNRYFVINWSFGADWKNLSSAKLKAAYKRNIKNGAIFLMHDLSANKKLLSFLEEFIDEIKKRGFQIVTVGELLDLHSPNIEKSLTKKEKRNTTKKATQKFDSYFSVNLNEENDKDLNTGTEKISKGKSGNSSSTMLNRNKKNKSKGNTENKINKKLTKEYQKLIKKAKNAAKNSYSPYSNFSFGCAVVTSAGKIYLGTNIENSSYSLSMCAERTALYNACADGLKEINALALYSENGVFPCGACRQVMLELAPNADVIIISKTGVDRIFKISELLPNAFLYKDLIKRTVSEK